MFKEEEGFTLIEMLIVLAIITILLVLVVPNLADKNEDVHEMGEDAIVQMANNQVQSYYIDQGKYPAIIEDLEEADYLSKDVIKKYKLKLTAKDGEDAPVVTIDDKS